MEEYYFIAFENTNSAMNAEDYLKGSNISVTIIPTPREVSESCGLSIKINPESIKDIRDLTEKGHIKIKGIYCVSRKNGSRKVERV